MKQISYGITFYTNLFYTEFNVSLIQLLHMKYIFFSFSGLAYPVAYQLVQEGHEVMVGVIEDIKDYVMEEEMSTAHEDAYTRKTRLELFDGMLDKKSADKIVEIMKKIDNPNDYFVFFEENNLYRWADKVRNLGFEGIFPTKENYLFEVDRQKAKEFVKTHYKKLYTPEVVTFEKKEEAFKFLETTDEFWVLKGNIDSAKALIPETADVKIANRLVAEYLEKYPNKYEKMGFILEKYLPSIIELTPERMYYDGVPVLTTVNIENKPFGAGNLSIQTGCTQDLVFPIAHDSRICEYAFPPIVDEMAKAHKGLFIWDASLLVDKRTGKIYFGEFCSNRPGYNCLFTELSQSNSVSNFFDDLVAKKNPLPLGTVGTSVRIFNLNQDDETDRVASDLEINYREKLQKDIWLWDVKKDKNNDLLTVGSDWNLAVVTGSGKSINEAINKTYRTLENLSFSGAYYRSKDDYLSLDYPTSILNRLNYGLDRGLYQLAFNVKVGDIR